MCERRNLDFERFLAVLGPRDFYALFAGKPVLDSDAGKYRVPENSSEKEWVWLTREYLSKAIEDYQAFGWTVWVSLNELRGGLKIEHVRKISVIWFDVDANRHRKTEPATAEEREEAMKQVRKLKEYLERRYGAKGFTASSGNGFHLYYPVPVLPLLTTQVRVQFNARLGLWMRRVRGRSGARFDFAYNINRLVQPIGYPNMKIPGRPLDTYWIDDFTLADVVEARHANVDMLREIVKQSVETERTANHPAQVPDFPELLRRNEWLREMYHGEWRKYGYPSRSEAELAVVRELVHWGFSDDEIRMIMSRCGIGKWQESGESYRRHTLQRAREWEAGKVIK